MGKTGLRRFGVWFPISDLSSHPVTKADDTANRDLPIFCFVSLVRPLGGRIKSRDSVLSKTTKMRLHKRATKKSGKDDKGSDWATSRVVQCKHRPAGGSALPDGGADRGG